MDLNGSAFDWIKYVAIVCACVWVRESVYVQLRPSIWLNKPKAGFDNFDVPASETEPKSCSQAFLSRFSICFAFKTPVCATCVYMGVCECLIYNQLCFRRIGLETFLKCRSTSTYIFYSGNKSRHGPNLEKQALNLIYFFPNSLLVLLFFRFFFCICCCQARNVAH